MDMDILAGFEPTRLVDRYYASTKLSLVIKTLCAFSDCHRGRDVVELCDKIMAVVDESIEDLYRRNNKEETQADD